MKLLNLKNIQSLRLVVMNQTETLSLIFMPESIFGENELSNNQKNEKVKITTSDATSILYQKR